jgi:lysyl endopeptidase
MRSIRPHSTIRIAAFVFVSLVFGGGQYAQHFDLAAIPLVTTSGLDRAFVEVDDRDREARGELELYGRLLPVGIDLLGQAIAVQEGQERVWRLRLASPEALAVELFFDRFQLSRSGRLFILGPEGEVLHGPYTAMEDPSGGPFTTPLVEGDECIVEYREPIGEEGSAELIIGQLGHAYRDVLMNPCQIDVACTPEGDGWQQTADGVVRISVVQPAGTGWCSGALMNNVRQDCRSFVLTAWHCGAGSLTAQFAQYKFYFGYQRTQCGTGSVAANKILTGAQFRAFSNDNSGNAGSDFMLLETTTAIPSSFAPYWSGWDATPLSTSSDDGVTIHHPLGLVKKVSTYTQTLTTGHWSSSSGLQSHWRVRWAASPNGHGITESGSSGAPLLKRDQAGRALVIGTLSGSAGVTCATPTGTAYYGKMSYHWTGNPNTTTQKLAHWLDPDGTGTLVLDGSYDPCGAWTGIQEQKPSSLRVFPNPADDHVSIYWEQALGETVTVEVFDMTGRSYSTSIVNSMNGLELSTRHLPPGAYSIRTSSLRRGSVVVPLIVVH